jgi:hypothetical protein
MLRFFTIAIISFIIYPLTNKAQSSFDKLKLIKTIELKAQSICTDKLGNVYAVANEEVFKFDAQGNLLQKNSLKSYGSLFSLDVSNPMKILAFYKDYNKVLFLDNMLAPTASSIDLSSIGFDQVTLTCSSHDNGMWVFNSLNFELVRMEPTLKISHQSGNIAQLTGSAIKPTSLFESNNKVYLCDTLFGVLVFDVFGTYIKTIPIKSIVDLQLENNVLYFIDKKGFGNFNLELLQQNELTLPQKDIKQIRLQKNRVFMRSNDKITIYSYQ